ncbi:hypothetical protein EV177_001114 [Coemansia sp. RSA 1804]|nr:hypothetical protein EV177_001114 [Coemansia sp. RSA 1804]
MPDDDDSSRIQVDSLLNPPMPNHHGMHAMHSPSVPLRKNLSSSALAQQSLFPPLSAGFSFSTNAISQPRLPPPPRHGSNPSSRFGRNRHSMASNTPGTPVATDDKKRFEMALWKQESGLGPPPSITIPTQQPPSMVPSGVPIKQREQQLPVSAPLHHAYKDPYGASGRHYVSHSSANGSTRLWAGKQGGRHQQQQQYATNYQQRQRQQQHQQRQYPEQRSNGAGHAEPQIFVPRQPIVGHSATSVDRSGDFIRPQHGAETMVGGSGPPSSSSFSFSPSAYDYGLFVSEPVVYPSDMHAPFSARGLSPQVPAGCAIPPDRMEVPGLMPPPPPPPQQQHQVLPPRMTAPSIVLPPLRAQASASLGAAVTGGGTDGRRRQSKILGSSSLSIPAPAVSRPPLASLGSRKRLRLESMASDNDDNDDDDDSQDNDVIMKESSSHQALSSYVGGNEPGRNGSGSVGDSEMESATVLLVQEPLRSFSLDSNSSSMSSAPLSVKVSSLPAPPKSAMAIGGGAAKPKGRRSPGRRKASPPASSSDKEQTTDKEQTADKEQTPAAAAKAGKEQAAPEDERPLFDWQKLEVPETIWIEAQELYDRVKVMKKVQNRQPICKRHAIHAALMFILCRNKGIPRTFSEICSAGNVTKREIGMYYNLMRQVLGKEYTAAGRAKPAEFLQRWCSVLELPAWIAAAATRVYDRADELAIVQGKCPISISAASLWLVIWCYNHRHALKALDFAVPPDTAVSSAALPAMAELRASKHAIACDQRDVCRAASVVIATLTSVFRLLLPRLQTLVGDMLDVHL